MDHPYINIHTHRRTGTGIEVVSVMAGRDLRQAAHAAMVAGAEDAADLAGTASVESELPEPPFSVGIHPWQVAAFDNLQLDDPQLESALNEVQSAPAWAVGEIGLDFAPSIVSDHSDLPEQKAEQEARQKTLFTAQLRIAEERRLPVVLHCVRAFEPVMEILAAHPRLPAVIFHGFIGSHEQAVRAVHKGHLLSFGQRSLSSPKTVEALKSIPLDNIFLETDDSPTPIADIYSRVAALLAVPLPQLTKHLYYNYQDRFVIRNS